MDPKTFLKELMINVGFSSLTYVASIKNLFFLLSYVEIHKTVHTLVDFHPGDGVRGGILLFHVNISNM